jgi:acetoacetyl-CoA synthetase
VSDVGAAAWVPTPERVAGARLTAFTRWLERSQGRQFADYEALWRWSTAEPRAFWAAAWEFLGLQARTPWTDVLSEEPMPRTRWFVGAELNFVD